MIMHISPATDEHDSRLMPCSSPLRCPYRNNQDANSAGMPLVHGDKAFIESAIKHAARKDAEISAALSEQIRNIELGVDSGLTSPEFKEWVKQKLWEKAHPDIRELDGFGFATDDEWAPWAGNTDMTPYYSTEEERQAVREKYEHASSEWVRKKIELESRPQLITVNYGDGVERYNLDYLTHSRSGIIPGTSPRDESTHNSYLFTTDSRLKSAGKDVQLDPNQSNLFIATYETNPSRLSASRFEPNHESLRGLKVEPIQAYSGARTYYTPLPGDVIKGEDGEFHFNPNMPSVLQDAPIAPTPSARKEDGSVWTERRTAGHTVEGSAYRAGAFELSGGRLNREQNTITTDLMRINDQNGDYTRTEHVYEPVFNRNANVLNVRNSVEAKTFAERFIRYDESEDTYSIDWGELKDAGIDMLVFDECKEGWDVVTGGGGQRGFAWSGLDHSTQSYILSGDIVCGWVQYDVGLRYAPYTGSRGGGH